VSEVVLVRPADAGDLEAVGEIYNHYVRTSHATFDIEPKDLAWGRRWLEAHASERHRALVAVREDRVVGFTTSGRYGKRAAYESSVETSVYVAPDSTGLGIGAELYAELLAALSGRGVHRALAGIALPNDASVRLHERFGFRRVALFTEQGWKFDRYWDVAWYERPID
jgi:phosphinothricin acetyltransferase